MNFFPQLPGYLADRTGPRKAEPEAEGSHQVITDTSVTQISKPVADAFYG